MNQHREREPANEAWLRQYLGGRGPDRQDEVADLIRGLASDEDAPGGIGLKQILHVAPWTRESDLVLDAAIQVTIEQDPGQDIVRVAESLAAEYPELSRHIQRAAILGALMETSGTGAARQSAILDLPSGFGPPDYDGRPRYELREFLGAGCQGTVYSAVDRLFSHPERPCLVALKLGHEPIAEQERERANGEALRARRISHPGVVRVTDHGRDESGRPFAAFEFVDGVALDVWVRSKPGPIAIRDAVRVVVELCDALQAAHSAGVVHRDLKPSNVLVDRSGAARVTDFGVAREPGLPLDVSRSYSSRGSLAFMAPEQYRCEPGADAPYADVYGLGGLLFWLLTGQFPNGDSARAAIDRLESPDGPARDPRESRPDTPDALARVVKRALCPSVTERYGSAQALGSDLRAWLDHRPIDWQRPTSTKRLAMVVRRHPIKSAASAIAVLLIAGLAVAVQQAVASARLQRAEAASALRESELQAQVALLQERYDAQKQRVADARERIETWMGVLGATRYVEPGEYLAVLGSLSRLEIFQDASVADALNENRIGIAREVLASLAAEGQSDSLEAAMWNALLGTWLLQVGEREEAIGHLAQAEQRMAAVLEADDPWLVSLREAISSGGGTRPQ
ncbi:MAG: serine/threonine-protein kinase [Phycisphaerales bacterium]